jgi:flagellar FliL protein
MSDKSAKEGKSKKAMSKLGLIILGAAGLLAVGGGGMFGLVQAGVIGGGHEEKKENDTPKLIRKGEVDPYAPVSKDKEDGAIDVDGEGGDEYRSAYFTFGEEFTSNLKNSDAMVQIALVCSTRRDGRVLIWLKKHELPIRSQLLGIIADTPEDDVYTIPGKEHLQKRLTAAINQVLTEKEGFGGVDAVYFRSFIVQ